MKWVRGQRIRLSDLGASGEVHLGLGAQPEGFDVVVAGLGDDDRLVDSGFLLSKHQTSSFEGSVAITPGRDGDLATVQVRLDRVPSSVRTVRVALIGGPYHSADSLKQAWLRRSTPTPCGNRGGSSCATQ